MGLDASEIAFLHHRRIDASQRVGCPEDGSVGPAAAPSGEDLEVIAPLDASLVPTPPQRGDLVLLVDPGAPFSLAAGTAAESESRPRQSRRRDVSA